MSSIVLSSYRSALARGGFVMAAIGLLAAGRADAACATAGTSYPTVVQDKECTSGGPLTPAAVSAAGFGMVPTGGDPDAPTTAEYVVYYNTTYSNQKLLVFLPGTGAPATDYTQLMLRAAYKGYRVIGMQYWQGPSGCVVRTEACMGTFRRNQYLNGDALDGGNAADAVRYRLRKLLQYLDAKYTNQTRGSITWGHFLANGGNSFPFINWGAVAIGGHSTGSRVSAWIASEVNAYRLFLFAGPHETVYDAGDEQELHPIVPSWLEEPMATPKSHIFAFSHTEDPKYAYAFYNWLAMGLQGETSVQPWNIANTPIASYARKLFSDLPGFDEPCPGPHNAPAHDLCANWTARVPVWDFMFSGLVIGP